MPFPKLLLVLPLLLANAPAQSWEPVWQAREPSRTETWAPARVLVFAHPGRDGALNVASDWLEYESMAAYEKNEGGQQPHFRSLANAETDIVLPDAPDGKPYTVGWMMFAGDRMEEIKTLEEPVFHVRHVVVGSGARLDAGFGNRRGKHLWSVFLDGDSPLGVHGNIHVRKGGDLYGYLVFLGERHSHVRIDGAPESLGHSFIVQKEKGASVLLLAERHDLVRGVRVRSGRFIVGSNTTLGLHATYAPRLDAKRLENPMGLENINGQLVVDTNGILELRSGAIVRFLNPQPMIAPDMVVEGGLLVSPAEGVSLRPSQLQLNLAEGSGEFLRQPGGLYFRPSARVANRGALLVTGPAGQAAARRDRGISVFWESTPPMGRIGFDHLRAGGLRALDSAWLQELRQSAAFGSLNSAAPDELLGPIERFRFEGGPGVVEFVDGLRTECEILFPHPNAPRLILRSLRRSIPQCVDLRTVHAVTIQGKRTEFHAPRALSAAEKLEREAQPLWPDIPDDENLGRYRDQTWEPAPLRVWADPGVSGDCTTGPNWLDERGVRVIEAFPSQASAPDVLLPASDNSYKVFGAGDGHDQFHSSRANLDLRHFSAGHGAMWDRPYNIAGNTWLKHGSGLRGWHWGGFTSHAPGVHRFLRLDGERITQLGTPIQYEESRRVILGHWMSVECGEGASLELIGQTAGPSDRIFIGGKGTVVLSERAYLGDGDRSAFGVFPEATLVLLQDAQVGYEGRVANQASMSLGGTLWIGHPDKPIRHDMVFPLVGLQEGKFSHTARFDVRTKGVSFSMAENATLRVHSVDPSIARVIFRLWDTPYARERTREKPSPDGIVLTLAGNADLQGVIFENVLPGGLAVRPRDRSAWRHVYADQGDRPLPADWIRPWPLQ